MFLQTIHMSGSSSQRRATDWHYFHSSTSSSSGASGYDGYTDASLTAKVREQQARRAAATVTTVTTPTLMHHAPVTVNGAKLASLPGTLPMNLGSRRLLQPPVMPLAVGKSSAPAHPMPPQPAAAINVPAPPTAAVVAAAPQPSAQHQFASSKAPGDRWKSWFRDICFGGKCSFCAF